MGNRKTAMLLFLLAFFAFFRLSRLSRPLRLRPLLPSCPCQLLPAPLHLALDWRNGYGLFLNDTYGSDDHVRAARISTPAGVGMSET